jgi:hypothetical protein
VDSRVVRVLGIHQRAHILDLRAAAGSPLYLSLGFSCECMLWFPLLCNFSVLGFGSCAMAKAGAKIQALLRKFLYDGRVSFVHDSNSLQFSAE